MRDLLKDTVARTLLVEPQDISDHTSMESCETWDSLRHFQLILAVEDAFAVRFPSETIPELTSVGRIREELGLL